VLGVQGPDIAAGTITANNIAVGTLTAEQIKAHSLSVESLAVGSPTNLIVDPAFTSAALNAARMTQAVESSATPNFAEWSYTAEGALRIDNNSTTSNHSRFGFTNNTLGTYPRRGIPGPPLPRPDAAITVAHLPSPTRG